MHETFVLGHLGSQDRVTLSRRKRGRLAHGDTSNAGLMIAVSDQQDIAVPRTTRGCSTFARYSLSLSGVEDLSPTGLSPQPSPAAQAPAKPS